MSRDNTSRQNQNVLFRRGVEYRSCCPPLVVAPTNGILRLGPASFSSSSTSPSTTPNQRQNSNSLNNSLSSTFSSNSINASPINRSIMSEYDQFGAGRGVRRPVQITADPRVYRGSVFANRRVAINNVKQVEKAETKEKKYRVGVIRDQLSSILPQVPTTSAKQQNQRLSSRTSRPKNDLISLPILARNSSASIDKTTTKSFSTARFSPLRNVKKTGDLFGINEIPSIQQSSQQYPVKVVVNFDEMRQRDIRLPNQRKLSKHVVLSQTTTPPTSPKPVYQIVDSGMQTEDNFDEKFDDLVKELATSAISMALFQIEGEDKLEEMTKTAETTKSRLISQTQRASEQKIKWEEEIIRKNAELENWKRHETEARKAQTIALETCREVTKKALENMKIMEKNSRKSIGLDTREMNTFTHKMSLITHELEKDFFPWLFQRSERLFRNQIVRDQLDHSMLNELHHRREMAKQRLISLNSSIL